MPQKKLDKRSVLQAAAALAEETGFENLTLNRLADRLGVKTPSLYNHISGLEDLQTGLAGLGLTRLGESLRNAAIGKSKDEALVCAAMAFRNFAKANPQTYRAIMKLPQINNGQLKESVDEIVQILLMVLEPYGYEKKEAMYIMRTWKSAIHGFISLESAGFFKAQYDIEESFERMISCILAGMKAT